jgi:hypothetical protein
MSPGAFGGAVFNVTVVVLCLMAAAYPVYRVVALWFDRALSTAEATIYVTLLVFLIVGIMATLGSPLGSLLIVVLLLSCCGLPLLNHLADSLALKRMEAHDIAEFSQELELHPTNAYARERLVRIRWGRKEYDEALAHTAAALKANPKDPAFLLLKDRIETERRRAATHAKVCPKCFVENPPDAGSCLGCDFRFVDPGDIVRTLLGEAGQQALRWSGLTFGLLGLVLLLCGVAAIAAGMLFLFGILCLMLYLYARLAAR